MNRRNELHFIKGLKLRLYIPICPTLSKSLYPFLPNPQWPRQALLTRKHAKERPRNVPWNNQFIGIQCAWDIGLWWRDNWWRRRKGERFSRFLRQLRCGWFGESISYIRQSLLFHHTGRLCSLWSLLGRSNFHPRTSLAFLIVSLLSEHSYWTAQQRIVGSSLVGSFL